MWFLHNLLLPLSLSLRVLSNAGIAGGKSRRDAHVPHIPATPLGKRFSSSFLLLRSFSVRPTVPVRGKGKAKPPATLSLPQARAIYFPFFSFSRVRAPFFFSNGPRARHRHRNMPVSEPPYTRDLSSVIELGGRVIFCPLLRRQLGDGELGATHPTVWHARRPCSSHASFF